MNEDFNNQEVEPTKKKIGKKGIAIAISIVLVIGILAGLTICYILPLSRYNHAISLFENKQYGEAQSWFKKAGDFKDAAKYYSAIEPLPQIYKTTMVSGNETELTEVRYEYVFDGENVVKITTTDNAGQIDTCYIEYDSIGNKIKETHESGDGSIDTCEYTYDDDGREIKRIKISSTGEKTVTDNEYDANGNKIKTTQTKNEEIHTIDYEYDQQGRLIQIMSDSNSKATCRFEYNNNGKLSKYTLESPSGNIETTEYKYDGKGNLIEEKIMNQSGQSSLVKYKNEFDNYGNVTKAVMTTDGYTSTVENRFDESGALVKKLTVSVYETNERTITTENSNFLFRFNKLKFEANNEVYIPARVKVQLLGLNE